MTAGRLIPARLKPTGRRALRAWQGHRRRRRVFFGSFGRTKPIDPYYGYSRGVPVDRVYIDRFVSDHADAISGHVLEVSSPTYTQRWGSNVERIDVLMVEEGNPVATVVADLAAAPHIASDTFDCAVITQTLQFIYDYEAAIATLYRVLKPGGTLLLTVPGITRISLDEDAQWGQWFHFTQRSLHRAVADVFGEDNVQSQGFGNVLTAASFLWGLAEHDLRPAQIAKRDPAYDVVVGVRATKKL
ncbi:MAG: methyltransferase domain-containing protein [Actinomycetota bacterium]|nr:methyltransferase domain-containing protein [Actinomycetota bacterium]